MEKERVILWYVLLFSVFPWSPILWGWVRKTKIPSKRRKRCITFHQINHLVFQLLIAFPLTLHFFYQRILIVCTYISLKYCAFQLFFRLLLKWRQLGLACLGTHLLLLWSRWWLFFCHRLVAFMYCVHFKDQK